ncbi:hypothetical protein [Actinoalloteichus caeruleus]|uniref:Uncharacterized protein n=1 Tax=Actinoalloteichus caeruleus DSM 43889 TaxID=1120930 RepID=A0ABT1JMW3_ACTCY|nr:hypothetical protein [Actinoalloteichus caeruleus]MCP2333858.1 hypothetical protein [Actinoalloteichus caeruleus DSM 43889]
MSEGGHHGENRQRRTWTALGRRLHWTLLGLSLVGFLVWMLVVQAAMPVWLDQGAACAARFDIDTTRVVVRTTLLPPRATCTFHEVPGEIAPVVTEYISPSLALVLTVMLPLPAASGVAGLLLLARRILTLGRTARGPDRDVPAPDPPQTSEGGTSRRTSHLLGAALLGVVAGTFGASVTMLSVVFGSWPASIASYGAIVLAVVVAATAMDAAFGPREGGRRGSRRRGLALGGLGCAVVLALCLRQKLDGDGMGEDGHGWIPLVSTVVFLLVAAVQWRLARRGR